MWLKRLVIISGSFLGLKPAPVKPGVEMEAEMTYMDSDDVDPVEEELNFKQMMENVGATRLFEE